MSMWTIDILPLAGGSPLVTSAPFKSCRVTWAADGVGAIEIDLRASDVASGSWLYGRRRVALKKPGGTRVFQGWLERLERSGGPGDIQYRAAGRGLSAILENRVIHGDTSWSSTVATTVATGLLAHIDAQTDDATNFTVGTITGPAARSVTRHYCDGEVISELLAELAEASPGGFAWEIDANGAFNAWVNGRGTDRSATVDLYPDYCTDWSCVGDTADLVTYVTGLADPQDESPCGPPLVIDFTTERTTYGRREVVISADSPDETELEKVTTEELRARIASRVNLHTAWIEGSGPWDFGDVWLGDVVDAGLGPEFGGNLDVRCIAVNVTLEPGTHEYVEMEWEAAESPSPAELPGLVAWLDADTITGLADGAAVGTWIDQSGTSHHFTQATAGNKPTYKTGIVNGKPVVRFDGSDWLDCPTLGLTQPYTLFFVIKATSPSNFYFWDGQAQNAGLLSAFGATTIRGYAGAIIDLSSPAIGAGFVVCAAKFNGASSQIAAGGYSGTGSLGAQNTTGSRLGGGYGVTNLTGDIAEVLVYSGALSATQINQVARYLANKYNRTWVDV